MRPDALANDFHDLDSLIAKLQHYRRKLKRNMPVRVADGYDNALPAYTVSLEKNSYWDGEPADEVYVCLSIG